jgi:hypothetical protein
MEPVGFHKSPLYLPLIPDPLFLIGYIQHFLRSLPLTERVRPDVYDRVLVHLFGGTLSAAQPGTPGGRVRDIVDDLVSSELAPLFAARRERANADLRALLEQQEQQPVLTRRQIIDRVFRKGS